MASTEHMARHDLSRLRLCVTRLRGRLALAMRVALVVAGLAALPT
jgi:hypothetical protein